MSANADQPRRTLRTPNPWMPETQSARSYKATLTKLPAALSSSCRGEFTSPASASLHPRGRDGLRPPGFWRMTAVRMRGARSRPRNVRLIHPYSDCSNPTRPGILPGADPFLVRFRTQPVASVTATLVSAIEATIESPGEPAARRLRREHIRRLTPPDGRRAMPSDGRQPMTPNGRHLNGPGPAKRAMPAACNAKPALAWRYPTRTPAPVRITSPPAPGRARAASAASETGSIPAAISPAAPGSADSDPGSRSSLSACRKNDCTPIEMAPLGASGGVVAPKMDAASPPSVATPVALPANGPPGMPASDRTSRHCDATHASAAGDSPAPATPPNPATAGSTPAMPNKKE